MNLSFDPPPLIHIILKLLLFTFSTLDYFIVFVFSMTTTNFDKRHQFISKY